LRLRRSPPNMKKESPNSVHSKKGDEKKGPGAKSYVWERKNKGRARCGAASQGGGETAIGRRFPVRSQRNAQRKEPKKGKGARLASPWREKRGEGSGCNHFFP